MRVITASMAALGIATAAFIVVMLTKPPVSQARAISNIDTYALTLNSPIASAREYDCN